MESGANVRKVFASQDWHRVCPERTKASIESSHIKSRASKPAAAGRRTQDAGCRMRNHEPVSVWYEATGQGSHRLAPAAAWAEPAAQGEHVTVPLPSAKEPGAHGCAAAHTAPEMLSDDEKTHTIETRITARKPERKLQPT